MIALDADSVLIAIIKSYDGTQQATNDPFYLANNKKKPQDESCGLVGLLLNSM